MDVYLMLMVNIREVHTGITISAKLEKRRRKRKRKMQWTFQSQKQILYLAPEGLLWKFGLMLWEEPGGCTQLRD
jgi:hypothetical protein